MNENDNSAQLQIDVTKISQELKIRPEIYLKILVSFTHTLKDKVVLLQEALTARNFDEMRRILHEIKGTSGNLRLPTISSHQETLHVAVKAQEPQEKLLEYMSRLKDETDKLYQYVQKMVSP